MRICLVDDDSTQLEYLKVLIEEWANKNNINTEISIYHSAEEMLFENEKSYLFDMILLDIQMGKINGIELAKQIREVDKNVIIAFISGMADYVFEGYNVQAIQYLLKPINQDKLIELLNIAKSMTLKKHKHLIITNSNDKKKINYDQIYYIESMGHNVIIHTEFEEINWKNNLKDISEDLLKNGFTITHRSYIVNLKHIEEVCKERCILSNNKEVPISRNSYKSVNDDFITYYRKGGF